MALSINPCIPCAGNVVLCFAEAHASVGRGRAACPTMLI